MTSPSPSGNDPVIVHVFGRTDVGRTREHNEDSFVVADLTTGNATLQPEVRTHTVGERGSLFMVADGMGGAAAGEIASAMAIDVVLQELLETFQEIPNPDHEVYATTIKRATSVANAQIHQYALEHPEYRGMGTTATVAAILGDTVYLAQVGDSRAYLVRDGKAQQITKDQSLMQKLIEAGEITEEEAELSERRNIILQALGPEANIKVDLTYQKIRKGDTLVLCSDGLSGQVKLQEISSIATDEPDLMQVCKRLIDRANENGGPDNITVIAVRFDGENLPRASSADSVGHRVFPLPSDTGQVMTRRTTSPSNAVTKEVEMSPFMDNRSTKPAPLPFDLAESIPLTQTPVSPARRMRGSMIALGLVIAFLAAATWIAYSMTATRTQGSQSSAPAPRP